MADDDECTLVPVQPAFQPINRAQIEVVGWFVHQQQIGVLCQCTGNGGAAFLAAACPFCLAAHVNAQLACDSLDLMFGRGMFASQCPVHQSGEAGQIRVLLQQHDASARLDLALALVRFDLVVDQFEQRGLAHAIAADQGDPVTRADMQIKRVVIRPAEQPFAALLQRDGFETEDRRLCHRSREVGAVCQHRKRLAFQPQSLRFIPRY